MRNGSRVSMFIIATVGVLTIFTLIVSSTPGQAPAAQRGQAPAQPAPRGQGATPAPARGQAAAAPATGRIPRMPDGKPNFTGLWQSMTTADWDSQDHVAQAGPY